MVATDPAGICGGHAVGRDEARQRAAAARGGAREARACDPLAAGRGAECGGRRRLDYGARQRHGSDWSSAGLLDTIASEDMHR